MEVDKSSAPVVESYLDSKSRIRISDLQEAKNRKERWTMLTCYDAISAKIFDNAKIPCLLVGDSAAQTVYGYNSTIPVTVDELIPLVRAVSSSCKRALVVADLPFGSYQESPQVALRNATRFMKEGGAHAVKLEGGRYYKEHVELLTRSGIPVMAHIGFTPQSEHMLGGIKVQGRGPQDDEYLHRDAVILEKAGAFACVLEMVHRSVASIFKHNPHHLVDEVLTIPVVGIGAGPDCDAQVLVWQDMVGFCAPNSSVGYLKEGGDSAAGQSASSSASYTPARVPKFVKKYANVGEMIHNAAIAFKNDVKNGTFPADENCYG